MPSLAKGGTDPRILHNLSRPRPWQIAGQQSVSPLQVKLRRASPCDHPPSQRVQRHGRSESDIDMTFYQSHEGRFHSELIKRERKRATFKLELPVQEPDALTLLPNRLCESKCDKVDKVDAMGTDCISIPNRRSHPVRAKIRLLFLKI